MKVFLAFALLFSCVVKGQGLEERVAEEVLRDLSITLGEGRTPLTLEDIGGVEIGPSTVDKCDSIATGYATKYELNGTYTVKFWACVNKEEIYLLNIDYVNN